MRELLGLFRRNRDFRLLFASATTSYLGDWFALVAVSSLVEELTGNEGSTALVFAAEVLPLFAMAPLAGVLADRVDRKRLMLGSDVARIVPALGLLAAAHLESAPLAYGCVAAISALAAFSQPVAPAVVPNLVVGRDLSLANAAIGSLWGSMLFVGAALGGLAAATLGREASFVLDAATFAVSALLLLGIRTPFSLARPVGEAGASVLAHLGEVWAYTRPRKAVRAFMVTKSGVGVGNGVVGLLPIFALDVFVAGEAGIGVLLAGRGLGALVGPFLGRRLFGDAGQRLVLGNGLAIVFFGLSYLLLPLAPNLPTAALVVTLAHLGGGHQWVASTLGLQRAVPDAIRGRVISLDFSLATLSIGLSSLGAAALANLVPLRWAVTVLAAVATTYGLVWLGWTRDLWRGEEDPLPPDVPASERA